MNELIIRAPEGMEIDMENSTLQCIRFKPIKWRADKTQEISGYYIAIDSSIVNSSSYNVPINYNVFATMKQAKSALAMARISQIIANDKRFGGVITDKEWLSKDRKHTIRRIQNKICRDFNVIGYNFLAFHTPEQRDLFLEENEDLIRDYLML